MFNNFLIDDLSQRLYFVQYHDPSRSRRDIYFTVNYFDVQANEIYEFERGFECLYIKRLLNQHTIQMYHSFHDQLPNRMDVFDMSNERFNKVD